MHRQTKYTNISPAVKRAVYLRDNGGCAMTATGHTTRGWRDRHCTSVLWPI